MNKGKIFISTSSFAKFSEEPLNLIDAAGYSYELNPHGRKLKKEEVGDLVKECVGLVAGTECLDADVINALNELKVISRCGVGMDSVDLNAAADKNITVVNTPDGPTLSVAELTIGLILNLLRKTLLMDQELRDGKWEKKMGSLLAGKNVGIIGFGRIGRKVGVLLKAFGCQVAFCDPFVEESIEGYQKMELEDLLSWSNIVSIHVSVSEKIIGKSEFEKMQKGSWIVNVSRGGVVDEEALYQNLNNQHLSGAALDVFEQEPYVGPLTECDQCILTPHIGSYAKEGRIEMETDAVKNLLEELSKGGV